MLQRNNKRCEGVSFLWYQELGRPTGEKTGSKAAVERVHGDRQARLLRLRSSKAGTGGSPRPEPAGQQPG